MFLATTGAEWLSRTFRGLGDPCPAQNANQRPREAADLHLCGADDGIRTRDPNLGKADCRRRDLQRRGI